MPEPPHRKNISNIKKTAYIVAVLLTILLVIAAVFSKIMPRTANNSSTVSNLEKELDKQNNKPDKQAKQEEVLKIGSPAPEWTLELVSGKKNTNSTNDPKAISLTDFRGRPVMLDFIATWCPHCRAMVPIVSKSINNSNTDYVMIGAAGEPGEKVKNFHENYAGIKSPGIAVIGNKKTNKQYNVIGTPTMIFINKNGIVKSVKSGEISSKELNQALRNIEQ